MTASQFAKGACPRCSRWITDDNPQCGRSCKGCITDWISEATVKRLDEIPVAYVPTGDPTYCAACGRETRGLDLCRRCDDTSHDPDQLVRR